jgi:hypothetical protein
MRRIVIKASDVAACVGQNRFKPAAEVLSEMWKRYSPTTFKGQTKQDAEMESLSKCFAAQSIATEALATRARTSDEAQTNFVRAQAEINELDTLGQEDKDRVIEHMRSKIYTSFGTGAERRTAEKVTAEQGVVLRTDTAFHEYEVCILDKTQFVIVGKVDRIELHPDGTKVLVEIKNRTKQLFRKVWPYENIQVQTYLQMLVLDRAKLIEQFNSETNTMLIERDDDLWQDEILPELVDFCRNLHDKL